MIALGSCVYQRIAIDNLVVSMREREMRVLTSVIVLLGMMLILKLVKMND